MLSLLLPLTLVARPAADAGPTQWHLSVFTWVKRVPAEPGAPTNAQPAQVSAEALRALLAPVRARVEKKEVALFGRDELKELAVALSEALALAQPGEDLILLSTSRHGGTLLDRTEAITARLFVQDGALNLIVHDARLEFLTAYQVMNVQPSFTYGTRGKASEERLQAPLATRLRPDWLAFPLTAPAPAPAPAATAAPLVAPAPVVPRAAPEPAPATAEAAAYEAKAQRLRTLKRLREDNLISEAEYQERRDAILKAL